MSDRQKLKKIKGIHYMTGEKIEISIKEGLISSIQRASGEIPDQIIAPGLVDLQINGFYGIDFNQSPLTLSEWTNITNKLSEVGVTTFYPTIITNSYNQLSYIFSENIKVIKDDFPGADMVGGFHLEGPYISGAEGPRGAHSKAHVRPPDWEEFCDLQEKAQGTIKIVTLSPEWPEAIGFIEKAVQTGVRVAIGHSAANTEQVQAAVDAGASLSTHLGNGAHVTLPRHPNYIWDQIAEEKLWASVISDGNHLPKSVLKVINQVKQKKMILISDSVALAGMEPGNYTTAVGGEVTLTPHGRLHLTNHKDILAGSAQHLLQGVKNLVDKEIAEIGDAINKATVYPATLMEIPQSRGLNTGAPADLFLLQRSLSNWKVLQSYKSGNLTYQDRGMQNGYNSEVL